MNGTTFLFFHPGHLGKQFLISGLHSSDIIEGFLFFKSAGQAVQSIHAVATQWTCSSFSWTQLRELWRSICQGRKMAFLQHWFGHVAYNHCAQALFWCSFTADGKIVCTCTQCESHWGPIHVPTFGWFYWTVLLHRWASFKDHHSLINWYFTVHAVAPLTVLWDGFHYCPNFVELVIAGLTSFLSYCVVIAVQAVLQCFEPSDGHTMTDAWSYIENMLWPVVLHGR